MGKINEMNLWFADVAKNSDKKDDFEEDFEPGFFVTGKQYEIELKNSSKILRFNDTCSIRVSLLWIEEYGIVVCGDGKRFFINWNEIKIAFEIGVKK